MINAHMRYGTVRLISGVKSQKVLVYRHHIAALCFFKHDFQGLEATGVTLESIQLCTD